MAASWRYDTGGNPNPGEVRERCATGLLVECYFAAKDYTSSFLTTPFKLLNHGCLQRRNRERKKRSEERGEQKKVTLNNVVDAW